MPISTVEVPIGTPQYSAQFPRLVHFGLFLGCFLKQAIILGHILDFFLNKIHFNLIIKSLKIIIFEIIILKF